MTRSFPEALKSFQAAAQSVVAARETGVKIALGTDAAHRFPHVPDAALELEYFVALANAAAGDNRGHSNSGVGIGRVEVALSTPAWADIVVERGSKL